MGWITKKKIGGAALAVAGYISLEISGWGIGRALDYLAANLSLAQLQAWPWGAWASIILIAVGLGLAFWPEPKGVDKTWPLVVAVDRALATYTTSKATYRQPDFTEANRVGEAALITLGKAGFKQPALDEAADIKARQIESYLREVQPLLRARHMKEAKAKGKEIASRAR